MFRTTLQTLAIGLLLPLLPCVLAQEPEPGPLPEVPPVEAFQPPNFEAYFPDDPAGGKALDAWFSRRNSSQPNPAIHIELIRKGLRRTTAQRNGILRWMGQKFIWEKNPQQAAAIELMYHAADYSPKADRYRTRHYAVYFGLSVTKPKTPRILQAFTELCMTEDNPETIGRVVWGCESDLPQLLKFLQPHLRSKNPQARTKALALQRIFKKEITAFEWDVEKKKSQSEARFKDKFQGTLLEFQGILESGDSQQRQALLTRLTQEDIAASMSSSFLPAFASAAKDPSPGVRKGVASVVGTRWILDAKTPSANAIEILIRLSRDTDESVRFEATKNGLALIRNGNTNALERLIEMASTQPHHDFAKPIQDALVSNRVPALAILKRHMQGDDKSLATWARGYYPRIAGRKPPITPSALANPTSLVGEWTLTLASSEGGPHIELPLQFRLAPNPTPKDVPLQGFAQSKPLQDLCFVQFEQQLNLAFVIHNSSVVYHAAGRLADGQLKGTARVEGKPQLMIWSAVRKR